MVAKPVFYRTHGFKCGQTALKSALSCLADDSFSHSLLDKLTGRHGNNWTYLVQIANALLKLNINFDYFALRSDLENILDIDLIKGVADFCEGNERIAAATDEKEVKNAIENVLKSRAIVEHLPGLDVLADRINEGYTNICCIDNSQIMRSPEPYHGHHVVVTWIGKYNVYYHDSGPDMATPHKKVRRKVFEDAWRKLHWFDYGLIVLRK